MDNIGVRNLAEAIVRQAMADYLFIYTTNAKSTYGVWGLNETKRNHDQAKQFFQSQYCEMLTGVEGYAILNRLDRMIKDGNARKAFHEARRGI